MHILAGGERPVVITVLDPKPITTFRVPSGDQYEVHEGQKGIAVTQRDGYPGCPHSYSFALTPNSARIANINLDLTAEKDITQRKVSRKNGRLLPGDLAVRIFKTEDYQ